MSRIPQAKSGNVRRGIPVPTSRIARPTTGAEVSMISQRDVTESGQAVVKVVPSDENLEGPSDLQKSTFKQSLAQSVQQPGKVVRTVGATRSLLRAPQIRTKRGKEEVVQQMKIEKTVQRTPKAEYIGQSVVGIDVDPTGTARKVELTSQQIDPTHATESAGVNETVATTSLLSLTKGGKQLKKTYKKRTVISDKLAAKPNLNPHHVSRLVIEEIEDVENTLKMVPPNLATSSVEKFPIKKQIQNMRLSAEPVKILTQSIVQPTPTADEVEAEAPPEVIASVLEAVEQGATPESAPNQIFNSLFPEVHEDRIGVSSVARGPLEDIVVPTDKSQKTVDEVLTQEMEDTIVSAVQNTQVPPKDDICSENNITPATSSTPKGDKRLPDLLEGELPPWEDATVQKVSALVGGEPINLLEASDFFELESPADISQELAKGIDYFIDADVVPYDTKIQIRGSKLPKWFPGYMSALPHLPGLVKISKCPHEVLQAAWKAVQPKAFPDDSLLIV